MKKEYFKSNFKIGDLISFPAFSSTSSNEDIGKSFGILG